MVEVSQLLRDKKAGDMDHQLHLQVRHSTAVVHNRVTGPLRGAFLYGEILTTLLFNVEVISQFCNQILRILKQVTLSVI